MNGDAITLEELLPRGTARLPRCVGGSRAGPPEDCGGVHRFREFVRAISNPDHPDHEEMMAWADGAYDPDEFDAQLALRFVEQELPDRYDEARDCFRRRGAYAAFKDLLGRQGALEKWYAFEADRTEEALRSWCAENGIALAS